MEFAPPLNNMRTQVCVILAGFDSSVDREAVWPAAAEEFLRKLHKLGVHITVVGPRPPKKFGSKKTIRFMDRHEVIGMKVLAASRSHRLEFRVLSRKNQSWTRLRAEACVTFGPYGVWPEAYAGWTLPGTISVNALSRWLGEQKFVPGREFAFIGSSNQVFRYGSLLLDRGVKSCFVIERGSELKCWRGHRDRFIAKGGRVLLKHQIQRVEAAANNMLNLYVSNDQGTLIASADTIVLAPVNEDALNAPKQWKSGLFYVQRRDSPFDSRPESKDEEAAFERLDWNEVYWRLGRLLEIVDHSDAEGALKSVRNQRREMLEYRSPGNRKDLTYSGKILDRETMSKVQSSVSVPRSFAHAKPMASLECFENIPCRACADACPESAIELSKITDFPHLLEDKCTGCGACVAACPAGVAVMVRELPVQQKARYFLPDDTKELWKTGKALQLLNRKGDVVGSGRVVSSLSYQEGRHRLLEIESTNVHLWDARNFRVPRNDSMMGQSETAASPLAQLRRGWVTLNGVKRLCPVDVPVSVALWQLGQRRFEDALFCHDGSCRMCEVNVDGVPALACKTVVRDGQEIAFEKKQKPTNLTQPLCPCKQVAAKEYMGMMSEGASEPLAREITGLGNGICHGRWCVASCELSSGEKLRPRFHGFESSPWRDLWAGDIADPRQINSDSNFDPET